MPYTDSAFGRLIYGFRVTSSAIALSFLSAACVTQDNAPIEQNQAARDASSVYVLPGIVKRLEPYGFAGVLSVSFGDGSAFETYAGMASWDEQRLHDSETEFDIASITKHLTALTILEFAADKRLSLEDPISNYFARLTEDVGGIKIAELLNHTSGLEKDPTGAGVDQYPEGLVVALQSTDLKSAPGSEFNYSNLGYCVLGRIIEIEAGAPLLSVFNERLFGKTDITVQNYSPNQSPQINLSLGHDRRNIPPELIDDPYDWSTLPVWECGASGIVMKASDVTAWGQMLFAYDGPYRERVPELLQFTNEAARGTKYAQGIRLATTESGTLAYHDGDTSGGETYFAHHLERGVTVFAASNDRSGWRDILSILVSKSLAEDDIALPPAEIGTALPENLPNSLSVLRFNNRTFATANDQFGVGLLRHDAPTKAQISAFKALADQTARAIEQDDPELLIPVLEGSGYDPAERLAELRDAIGFTPSKFEIIGTTPWRSNIYQSHVVFVADDGLTETVLRFVWHPSRDLLLFFGTAQDRTLLRSILVQTAAQEYSVLDTRAKRFRSITFDSIGVEATDWIQMDQ